MTLLLALALSRVEGLLQQGRPPLTIPEVGKDQLVCFCLYTTRGDVLKLTAQLYPLAKDDPRTVRLEIRAGDAWKEIARTEVVERGWTAHFRVERWDTTKDVDYQIGRASCRERV